jgi:hypothetical protein
VHSPHGDASGIQYNVTMRSRLNATSAVGAERGEFQSTHTCARILCTNVKLDGSGFALTDTFLYVNQPRPPTSPPERSHSAEFLVTLHYSDLYQRY